MYKELFCERLAQLRIKKGVSARDMSLSLGQSPGYINNIENRKNLPSMAAFFNICEYLQITPRDFFFVVAANPLLLTGLIKELKALDEKQLGNILEIAKGLKRD